MKCFTVNGDDVKAGIRVITEEPYPRIIIGRGGHKRATWIPLGSRDADRIIHDGSVYDAGVVALRDKETGKPDGRYLIVAPRPGQDNRALVLWRVPSGYRGSADIMADEGVIVVGYDHAWRSGRGALGETAEMLALLAPGQSLKARRTGRRVQDTAGRLTWTGKDIQVAFFPAGLDPVELESAEFDIL